MYPVKVSAKTDKVPTPRGRGDIDQLVVVFTPFVISVVRTTEIDETRNTDFRPDLIGRSEQGSARAHLKSKAIKGIVAEHRRKRACDSLVLNKAAAPTTRIDQTSGIEGVSHFAIISQGILEQ